MYIFQFPPKPQKKVDRKLVESVVSRMNYHTKIGMSQNAVIKFVFIMVV